MDFELKIRSSQVLAIAFFISVFSTVTWLIYTFMYISEKLHGISFNSLGLVDLSVYTALVLLPILVLWMVFGYINQYISTNAFNKNLFSLFKQMKKNQDYTDLIARIMLESEQEIKDGFILGKFDLFVADMNELIAEIIHRSSIASPEQIERLWAKVQNGGKWSFGKVIIEVNQNQPRFQARVFEKSQSDVVLAGTILEFCSRYTNLIALLEKHDKERVFLNIIETGVFGKVFSIIAPVADEVRKSRDVGSIRPAFISESVEKEPQISKREPVTSYTPTPRPVYKKEPKVEIKSIITSINPFKKKHYEPVKSEPRVEVSEDPFSMALQRSFGSDDTAIDEPHFSSPMFEPINEEPSMPEIKINIEPQISVENEFFIEKPEPIVEPKIERVVLREEPVEFSNTQKTLNNLKKEWDEMKKAEDKAFAKPKAKEEEENLSYPFGGWTDEENYSK